MTYTKTALNKFKKEQLIALYIEDQKKWIQDSKEHDEAVKQLLIQKAQAENSYKLLSDKYQVDLRQSSGGYRAKINRLEKENEELKSQINSNSPNNLTLIKNLKNANKNLKEEINNNNFKNIISGYEDLVDKLDKEFPELLVYCGEREWELREDLVKQYQTSKEELEKVKEEHIHFNTIWKTEGITEQDIIDMKRQISEQCDIIKTLKQEHKELTQKHEYYYKLINQIKPLTDKMFDSL